MEDMWILSDYLNVYYKDMMGNQNIYPLMLTQYKYMLNNGNITKMIAIILS